MNASEADRRLVRWLAVNASIVRLERAERMPRHERNLRIVSLAPALERAERAAARIEAALADPMKTHRSMASA